MKIKIYHHMTRQHGCLNEDFVHMQKVSAGPKNATSTDQSMAPIGKATRTYRQLDTYRGSYRSVHVLLNLLNELRKEIKCEALPRILSLFRNEFKEFNNTEAR